MATSDREVAPHVVEGTVVEEGALEQPPIGQLLTAEGSLITEPVLGLRMLMSSRVSVPTPFKFPLII